jgi:hypothetical protein
MVTLEGKVQSLRGEVTDDVGGVTAPEGENTFFPGGTAKAFNDTTITLGKTARLYRELVHPQTSCLLCGISYFTLIISS